MKSVLQTIQVRNITAVIALPSLGLYLATQTPLKKETLIWAIIYYILTGIGITAGYHRLWSHRSYTASFPVQVYLSLAGAACLQGSILTWCTDHRIHHRYVDTDADPYSINKGFWHAHMGWLLYSQESSSKPKSQIKTTDLATNSLVLFQHKYFLILSLTFGLLVPSLISGLLLDDYRGGFVYAGLLRIFFFQQATFCVNSLAHWLGDQPYDDKHSPKDSVITAIITFGEGYHNFHHEFPQDFRNGVKWFQFDPSKWIIWVWWKVGLAKELKMFENNVIVKGEVQQLEKKAKKISDGLDWGVRGSELRCMTLEDFKNEVEAGEQLVCIEGFVYDVKSFINLHPGGSEILSWFVGRDASEAFSGGVYSHSNAAHNLLDDFRCGVLNGEAVN